MKNKLLFAFIVLLSINGLKAQYAAQNFSLLSLTDPEPGTGFKYSACFGWAQPGNGREYAIACSKNGTYWVDVTNPVTPTVSAYKAGASSNGTWRETKTYQNYCYVVCDDASSTGFQIFDMSPLPSTVTLVSHNMNLFKRGHAAWVDGNKLYVSGVTYSNNTTSSMDVYSLATPSAPVLLRQLKQDYNFVSYVHDEFVRNDTVFASCGNQGMFIFKYNSITNNFVQLGALTSYTASGYNHSSALTPDGKTLVFMDEVPAGLPIKVADVTNLANIQILATMNQYTQTTPHNPFMVSQQYCFASAYRDGTQLWDISTPTAPVLAGYFDTHPQTGGNNNNWTGSAYDGQWGMYPWFPSKNIFALDEQNGIFMLATPLYANPETDVTGNGNAVNDGAVTTSTNNNTNFGTVNVGSNLSNTFVIQNNGIGSLQVSGITVTGANATDFSITTPLTFSVAASASAALVVQFAPAAAGTRSAVITINNNDLNEAAYDFVVSGDGNSLSTGITNFQKEGDARFSIFPIPVKNDMEFTLTDGMSDKELVVKIYDATGKLAAVRQGTDIVKNSNGFKVNVSELNAGVYTVTLFAGSSDSGSKKILISR